MARVLALAPHGVPALLAIIPTSRLLHLAWVCTHRHGDALLAARESVHAELISLTTIQYIRCMAVTLSLSLRVLLLRPDRFHAGFGRMLHEITRWLPVSSVLVVQIAALLHAIAAAPPTYID